MRDGTLLTGDHAAAAIEPHILPLAQKQMPKGKAVAGTTLPDARRRAASLAMVADKSVAAAPILYRLLAQAARRQGASRDFIRQARRFGFWDNAGYQATLRAYGSAFGAPPPTSTLFPPMLVLPQMRALWSAHSGSAVLMVLGIVPDWDQEALAGTALTAISPGGMIWAVRGVSLAKG